LFFKFVSSTTTVAEKRHLLGCLLKLKWNLNVQREFCNLIFVSDIDECATMPCKNGSTCIDKVNDFRCNCLPGSTGLTCGIGENSTLKVLQYFEST